MTEFGLAHAVRLASDRFQYGVTVILQQLICLLVVASTGYDREMSLCTASNKGKDFNPTVNTCTNTFWEVPASNQVTSPFYQIFMERLAQDFNVEKKYAQESAELCK